MREIFYEALSGLPSKVIGNTIGIGGMVATAWPDQFRKWVAFSMTPEQIRIFGICAVILFVVYWGLIVWLKPKDALRSAPLAHSSTTHGPSSPSILGDGAHVHYGNVTNINVPPGRDFVTPRYDKERADITSLNRDRPWIVSVLTRDEESSKFANQVITYLQKIGLPLEQVHPGFIAISGDQVFDLAVHIDARTIIIGARS